MPAAPALFLALSMFSQVRSASEPYTLRLSDTSIGIEADTPTLSLMSGIGGSGFINSFLHPYLQTDFASGMALDSAGNIYLAGFAYSSDFPLVNQHPVSAVCSSASCACPSSFAAKLTPDARKIVYSTFLTACSDTPPAIAVDAAGDAYVAGTLGAGGAAADVFVVKLDPNGALLATLTFGGSAADSASAIALGSDGRLYVTGTTASADFPVSANALHKAISSAQDIFLMKLDPTLLAGSSVPAGAVLYSTFLGPGSSPLVAADVAGNAYVAASTTSGAWIPTANVVQPACSGRSQCADAIALKIDPAGSRFLYTTYLGGSGTDTIGAIAVDPSGSAYLAGTTNSGDFPTTPGAWVSQIDIGASRLAQTAFVSKLSPDASRFIYSTLLSPENGLSGTAIAVDSSGNAWMGGTAVSAALPSVPLQFAIQPNLFNVICGNYTPSGSIPTSESYCPRAGYLAELNPGGTSLLYATYLGGGNVSAHYSATTPPLPAVNAILVDAAGNVTVAGSQLDMRNTAASSSPSNSASVVRLAPGAQGLSYGAIESATGFGGGLPLPGGLAALYIDGPALPATLLASGLPLPIQLGGFTILVDGVPSPIVAAAPVRNGITQVNFQVPFEIPGGAAGSGPSPHIVEVQYGGQSMFLTPAQAGPGIFTLPDGSGAIQHASDYSLVTVANPVRRGETLVIYATGLGPLLTPIASGTPATAADPVVSGCNHLGTNAGTILYAGLTPGFPGLYQVNVQVSEYLPPGVNYLYLDATACWLFAPPPGSYQGNSVGVYIP